MKSQLFLIVTFTTQSLLASECVQSSPNHPLDLFISATSKVSSALSPNLPMDNVGSNLKEMPYSDRYSGFSYFIGQGNERYEKVEGYDDVYIYMDYYDPNKHPLNNLMKGSHVIIKYDRSVNPPKIIYLSQQKQLADKSVEETRTYKTVNETLCSLNKACNNKLDGFNKIVDSTEFNTAAVNQYKEAIINRTNYRLIVDVYHNFPDIKGKIQKVFAQIKTNSFANIDEVNIYLEKELTKISTDQLQGKNMQQYKEFIQKNKPTEDYLQYFDYSSIVPNISIDLKKYSYLSKKEAIYSYCKQSSQTSCLAVNSLKVDMDAINSSRVVIKDLP